MTDYGALSIEQAIYLHEKIVERAGGKQGVRDYTLLHSALERCKATFGGRDLYPTLFHKAGALLHSLVMNHSFLDGNKRTAYQTMKRFMYINGYQIKSSQEDIVTMCVAVDNDGWGVGEIIKWLKENTCQR